MNKTHLSIKTITAIVIGNALEWYDFVIYSLLTIFIAKLFFPSVNATNSLLAATATFGVAFCIRPFGGILIGIYADKKGRKSAITGIIILMTIAILTIAITPTYVQIGIAASIIIMLARLLQGFSAGGEFGTSTALLAELSPANQRGFYCSWQMVGQSLAMLLGTVVCMTLTNYMNMGKIETWGWRLPFIFGLVILPIGIYIRMHLDETPIDSNKCPKPQLKNYLRQILISIGLVIGGTAATYINHLYMPTYAHTYLHLDLHSSYIASGFGVFIAILFIPVFGWLSDHIGKKPILLTALFSYLILVYPLFFWLVQSPSITKLAIVQVIICTTLGAYFGVFAALIAEQFPKEIRSTGLSISYNLAVMLFGGFAQFIVTWLIKVTNTPLSVTYYLLIAISISLIAAIFYTEQEDSSYIEQFAM